ncbi:MAG: endonuclease/exonuclease/phosphatase family protein [Bryobacteraceae bacterium]|nr:endonuclease/exonuclease/phosphatase family protein [Bryobacteraceae bacterium]
MRSILLLALWLMSLCAGAAELRVMTFNVRYPNPADGANAWPARRDLVVEMIRSRRPDLIGTQELFYEQGQYIVEKLPEYAWFGLSRRGSHEDEHMGVFYRKDRLRVVDSGDFWLSTTPEKPGSLSWNMSLPRMVTWAQFEVAGTGARFYYFNTHFAHRDTDEAARLKSARLLACRIGLLEEDAPVLVTGDFNAFAGGPVYQTLVPMLADAWREAAIKKGPEDTFHGFTGKPRPGRIDWILFRAPWKVRLAETVTDRKGNVFPSDHFPVLAVFELP